MKVAQRRTRFGFLATPETGEVRDSPESNYNGRCARTMEEYRHSRCLDGIFLTVERPAASHGALPMDHEFWFALRSRITC